MNVKEEFKNEIIERAEIEFAKKGKVTHFGYLLTEDDKVVVIPMGTPYPSGRDFLSQFVIPLAIRENNGVMLGIVAEAWVSDRVGKEKDKLYDNRNFTSTNENSMKEVVVVIFESFTMSEVQMWDIKRCKKKPFLANKNILKDRIYGGRYLNFFSENKITNSPN